MFIRIDKALFTLDIQFCKYLTLYFLNNSESTLQLVKVS